MEEKTPTQPKFYKNARVWMAVTIIVVILAVGAITFFLVKKNQVKEGLDTDITTPVEQQTEVQAKPADTKSVAKELKSIDLSEIKAAVNELKTTFAAF